MGQNEEGGVHPFFSLNKDKAKTFKDPMSVAGTPLAFLPNPSGKTIATQNPSTPSEAPEPEQEHNNDVGLVAATSKTSLGSADGTDETKASKPKRAPRAAKKSGGEGKKQIKGVAQKNLMEKTFRSTSSAQVHQALNETPEFESDLNDSRRKRRRTDSVDPTSPIDGSTAIGTSGEQLKTATHDSTSPKLDERPQDDLKSTENPNPSLLLDPETLTTLSKNDQGPAEDLQLMGETVDANANAVPPPKAATPKTKILKLRKDGKLVSPKPQGGTGIQKNKVGRPKKNVAGTRRVKIVTMKYGKDSESRATMGQRIEQIWAGPPSNAKIPPEKIQRPTSTAVPQGPPKPPHPFFSGKLAPPINLKSGNTVKSRRSSIDLQSVRSGTTSPQKKSTAIAPDAAQAWAALSALGHRTMSTDFARITRFPGAMEPLWPPRNMQHCRGVSSTGDEVSLALSSRQTIPSGKKSKGSEIQIHPSEDVFYPLRQYYQVHELASKGQHNRESKMKILRRPGRRLMTGSELQEALRPRVTSKLPLLTSVMALQSSPPVSTHAALLHVFKGIASSFSAFDKFQCETRDWVQKYSPCCAAHVLQQGKEAVLLRDWLKSLTVTSVDTGNASKAKSSDTPPKKRKKKRKRTGELDDFIISSEEDANEMDELTDPESISPGNDGFFGPRRSVINTRRNSNPLNGSAKISNAVVISGPHGCGKTAAVYAVAQELGFEVFEINSGNRRSGRDLLDRVGDVARNHLVHQHKDTDSLLDVDGQSSAALQDDIDSGRQKTMQSFLKPQGKGRPASKTRAEDKMPAAKLRDPEKKPKQQKQSLILLEEVDILFEEDKQFWTTVLGLISQSKRPIIMTCTDESRLPLESMILHAIFRFMPPPEQLAVDYLVLMAGNEGHLLSRDAVCKLYKSKNFDLRASITELNFWCQMAVGDMKGGLEWMLIRSNAEECHNDRGQPLRVVSDGTYCTGMGLSCRDQAYDSLENDISDEMQLMSEAMREWDYEEDMCDLLDPEVVLAASKDMSAQQSLGLLKIYDVSFDALSVADVLPCIGLRQGNDVLLDITEPELTDTVRANYIEGFKLLQTDPSRDQTNMSTLIPLALKACTKELLSERINKAIFFSVQETLDHHTMEPRNTRSSTEMTNGIMAAAFKPLEETSKSSAFAVLQSRGAQITTFDGPLSIVAEDVAPYVRSIVSYDILLEERRLHLSNLLSQGGRNGKRQRTTRASRAALEGGSKENTRRERWFPYNTNFSLVLQTGGKEWQQVALQMAKGESKDESVGEAASYGGSRRSSQASIASEVSF
ncbi:hypothetical protein MMC30_007784 [Trapelia coarctata]|nr:hypothetical protein [Trapelia coarctata]